ncbi:MAG: extracellular solute-binding protein [Enterocloster asparagiformis]|nr:extracellular solute-binding protein [Enterocloster asparagiformis]
MNRRRGFGKLAVALIAAVGLTACSAGGAGVQSEPAKTGTLAENGEPCRIVLWHYYNDLQKESLDQIIAEYNRTEGAQKGITVEAYSQGSITELSNKMDLIVNDSTNQVEIPNMFMAYRDMASKIWRNKPELLVDCGKYFTEEDLSRYYEAYVQEGYLGDGLYIIPVAKSTELLMMNQTRLEEFLQANPDYSTGDMATWEGLARMAEGYYNWTDSLTPDVPLDGKPFIGMDILANYFIAMNNAMGSEIYHYGQDGQMVLDLDRECVERLFENYYIPYTKGYYGASGKYRSDDIRQSVLAGYIGSSSSTLYFPKEVTDSEGNMAPIEMGMYPYPYLENGTKTAIQQGAGIVTVQKSDRESEACMDFIHWLTTERSFEVALSMSYMPVVKDELDESQKDSVKDPNVLKALELGLEQSRDYQMVHGFDFENAYSVRQELEEYFSSVLAGGREEFLGYLNGGMSIEEAAEQMNYGQKADEFYRQVEEMFAVK